MTNEPNVKKEEGDEATSVSVQSLALSWKIKEVEFPHEKRTKKKMG